MTGLSVVIAGPDPAIQGNRVQRLRLRPTRSSRVVTGENRDVFFLGREI